MFDGSDKYRKHIPVVYDRIYGAGAELTTLRSAGPLVHRRRVSC